MRRPSVLRRCQGTFLVASSWEHIPTVLVSNTIASANVTLTHLHFQAIGTVLLTSAAKTFPRASKYEAWQKSSETVTRKLCIWKRFTKPHYQLQSGFLWRLYIVGNASSTLYSNVRRRLMLSFSTVLSQLFGCSHFHNDDLLGWMLVRKEKSAIFRFNEEQNYWNAVSRQKFCDR